MSQPELARVPVETSSGALTIATSTSVIDHIQPARTFGRAQLGHVEHEDYQDRLVAIPDLQPAGPVADGPALPMVMSLGAAGLLHLVRRNDQVFGGWERIDLHAGLARLAGGALKVTAFDAHWTAAGDIGLAVAADVGDGTANSRLFVAVLPKKTAVDWKAIPWQDCGTGPSPIHVEGIRITTVAGRWMFFLSGVVRKGTQRRAVTSWLMQYTAGQKDPLLFAQASPYGAPIDMKRLRKFDFSQAAYQGALYALGVSESNHRVLYRLTVPLLRKGHPLTPAGAVAYKCPDKATMLALGRQTLAGADLYVGGTSVQRLAAADHQLSGERTRLATVIPESALPQQVSRLVVTAAPDERTGTGPATSRTAVWALAGDTLVLATGEVTDKDAKWAPPVTVRRGVEDIAAVPNRRHALASVFVVYKDRGAAFLWKDDATGVWQETPVRIDDPDACAVGAAYSTSVQITGPDLAPQPGLEVEVTASVLSSVILNGRSVMIGPKLAAKAQCDDSGIIDLLNAADTFTPATYRIKLPGARRQVAINPAAAVMERFRTVTADQLRGVGPAGAGKAPLLPGGADGAEQAEATAGVLHQLAGLHASTGGKGAGIWLLDGKDAEAANDTGTAFGYRIGENETALTPLAPAAATSLAAAPAPAAGSGASGVWASLSDFFESVITRVKSGIRQATEFVVQKVKEGWRFVCKIASDIKAFVVNTIEEIGSLFKWVWERAKVGVTKVLDWLKFAFNWNDILVVRDLLVRSVKTGIQGARKAITELEGRVDVAFRQFKRQISLWGAKAGVREGGRIDPKAVAPELNLLPDLLKPVKVALDAVARIQDMILNNPLSRWVRNVLAKAINFVISVDAPMNAVEAPGLGDTLNQLWTVFTTQYAEFKADFLEIFGNKPTFADLIGPKFTRLILCLGIRAAEGTVDAFRIIVSRILAMVGSFVSLIETALFTRFRFPFIENIAAFFKWRVDTSVRIIDVVGLMAAIPATVGFKIITGRAPSAGLATYDPPLHKPAAAQSIGTAMDEGKRIWTEWTCIHSLLGVGLTLYNSAKNIADGLGSLGSTSVGITDWAGWVLGALKLLTEEFPFGRPMKHGARTFYLLHFAVGIYAVCYKCQRMIAKPATPQAEYPAFVEASARWYLLIDIGKMLLRWVAYACDPKAWSHRNMAEFSFKTVGDGLAQAAKLSKVPKLKIALCIGSAVFIVPGATLGVVKAIDAATELGNDAFKAAGTSTVTALEAAADRISGAFSGWTEGPVREPFAADAALA